MKFLALILSLYFAAASVFPCSDLSSVLFSSHGEHATQQTETGGDDGCSTLCACTCCGIGFDAPRITIALNPLFISSQRFIPASSLAFTDGTSSVWQPPKIS